MSVTPTVVVSLLPDPGGSDRLLQRLAGVRPDLTLLRPPDALLGGLWDDDGGVDEWWASAVGPLSRTHMVVVDHTPSRPQDLRCCPGVGRWVVWCQDPAATAAYTGCHGVLTVAASDLDGFADAVQQHLAEEQSAPRSVSPVGAASPPPPPIAARAVATRPPASPTGAGVRPPPGPPLSVAQWGRPVQARTSAATKRLQPPPPPFAALASALPRMAPAAASGPGPIGAPLAAWPAAAVTPPTLSAGPDGPRQRSRRTRRSITAEVATALGSAVAAVRDRLVASQARPDLAALGQELVRRHSLIVVALNTKGGVGKTTNCSALALLGGKAVEPHGGSAVFIDANPTNPNGRAKLGLPVDTPGLRALIDALATGAVPPAGARLKGYRAQAFTGAQGSGFGHAEVRRVAAHLRTVFNLVVVDLANAYPSLSGGPSGESAHHWLQEADVVLVPTDPDENTFEGAGETIDAVEEMAEAARKPRPPIVVSFLVRPRGEALREPGIRECLAHLNESGIPVVPVPNIERIALASWRKEQVTEVSPQANRAWEQVLAAIVSAEPGQEQGR